MQKLAPPLESFSIFIPCLKTGLPDENVKKKPNRLF